MDFHLDSLLNLPNVTVFTSSQKEGFIFLKLDFLNERLPFLEMRRNYTIRYEEYIYERVKELTVEQVSKNEQLSAEQVERIFQRVARLKKKTGEPLNV